MQYKKIGLALALSASFSLLACGDSDSSPSTAGGGDEIISISCKVQKDPFKTITKGDGFTTEETITFDKDKIILKFVSKFDKQSLADETCNEAKEDGDEDVNVECEGKTVTLTTTTKGDEDLFEKIKEDEIQTCDNRNNTVAKSSNSGKSSSSKNGKSSSSSTKTDKSGFTLIEYEGGYYRGHGCDFKMSDKTWEFAYEEKYGSIIAETKVVCEDLDDEDYSYADKICTQTVTYDDEEIYEECQEEKTENFETICKDGLSIEKYFDRDNTEDLFISTMKFCQRINLNPDWEYKPESSDSKDKSSSSKKNTNMMDTDDDNINGDDDDDEGDERDEGDEGDYYDVIKTTNCENFDVDDEVWNFSVIISGFTEIVKVEWLSKDKYRMTTYIEGFENEKETSTKTIEEGETRQSMYNDVCEDND